MSIIWCISITNNVKSNKKFNETAQTANFTDFPLILCENGPKGTKTMQTQSCFLGLENFWGIQGMPSESLGKTLSGWCHLYWGIARKARKKEKFLQEMFPHLFPHSVFALFRKTKPCLCFVLFQGSVYLLQSKADYLLAVICRLLWPILTRIQRHPGIVAAKGKR